MFGWFKNGTRFVLVTIGIVLLTSFTIDATDTLRGSQTALGILADKVTETGCPLGMVRVGDRDNAFCIDQYEVSPSVGCLYQTPNNVSETAFNITSPDCFAATVPSATPWTFVAKPQAEQLCAKSQKRLPTASEWYESSLGTPDSEMNCNLSGNLNLTGSLAECRSGVGAFDLVGNVWEIVDASVTSGLYEQRELPKSGYVNLIDESGIALETSDEPNIIYNHDYFWSQAAGEFILMRGGFYGSGSDGGVYATHAQGNQNFASAAIGFRCAKSL